MTYFSVKYTSRITLLLAHEPTHVARSVAVLVMEENMIVLVYIMWFFYLMDWMAGIIQTKKKFAKHLTKRALIPMQKDHHVYIHACKK